MEYFKPISVDDFIEMIDEGGKPINVTDFESDIPSFRISDYINPENVKKESRLIFKEGKIEYILLDSKKISTRFPGYGACKAIILSFKGRGLSTKDELLVYDFEKKLYLIEDKIDTAIDFAASLGGVDTENFDYSLINFADYIGATGIGEWKYFYESTGKAKCGYLASILTSSKAGISRT